jgi:acetyltransferase-like isoleucine patch superfamily enzyme
MNKILGLLLFFFPSFIQVPVRRLVGQRIGKNTKIKFGTLLLSSNITIGDHVVIGPFCLIRAEELAIGNYSSIKALSIISTRVILLAEYVHIAPLSIISSEFTKNSRIEIGSHSRIFPFCWLDTGEGIYIGKQVGVGGHTLIFTHGVWANYLEGGPVSYGAVTLHDNVWLPWRTFILPTVEIGENVIVGANSLVNKSFPKNVLIGGSPAKILKEHAYPILSAEQKQERAKEILANFSDYLEFKLNVKSQLENNELVFDSCKIVIDDHTKSNSGDLLVLINHSVLNTEMKELNQKGISVVHHQANVVVLTTNNPIYKNYIAYLRRYGIRLNIHSPL